MSDENKPDIEIDFDLDFDAATEREPEAGVGDVGKPTDGGSGKVGLVPESADEFARTVAKLLGPLTVRLEELGKSTAEHGRLLERLSSLGRAFEANNQMLEMLRERLEKLENAESRAIGKKMFDALYEELQQRKDDYHFDRYELPLLKEIIGMHDALSDFEWQVNAIQSTLEQGGVSAALFEEAGYHYLRENLVNLKAHVTEVLSRSELEVVASESQQLDKRLQRAIRVVETDQPGLDGMVKEVLRPAFVREERVIRPANVVIFRYAEERADAVPPSDAPGS